MVHLGGGELLFFSLGVDFAEIIIAQMHFPVSKYLNSSGLNGLNIMSTELSWNHNTIILNGWEILNLLILFNTTMKDV
jgi:hypothetical protein